MHLLKKNNFWTALVLTFALILGVVGLGLYSVYAENVTRSVDDLVVKRAPDGVWYAYEKTAETDTISLEAGPGDRQALDYTGVAKNSKGWWRVENGKVNFNATGIYYNEKGYWYVKTGKVQFGYTGFLQTNYKVDRVKGSPLYSSENGKPQQKMVDTKGTNTATVSTERCFWFLSGGKVQTTYTGAKKGNIDGTNAWWRVQNGRADLKYKGVAKNENGWFYFENGKVDFDHTGVEKNDYGWWRIENGKVNFNYNGVASNKYGSWYIVNGKVDFNYNGAFELDGTMYVVENGKVVLTQKLSVNALSAIRPTVKFTYDGAELSWSAVNGLGNKKVDGYEIYVKSKPTDKYSKVATVDANTTSYHHFVGKGTDPSQNPRLYDVRAIQKNQYGIVVATSPENKQTVENNFVGGAFDLKTPDIVSVKDNGVTRVITFKTVPYATEYFIYYGVSTGEGTAANWRKVSSVKAQDSGSSSLEAAKKGWTKGNQTVTIPKLSGYDTVTVKATYSERAGNGYKALTLSSGYDTGFLLDQTRLQGQKVLFMGDSLIAGTPYGPATPDYTIPTRVAQQTGASVYNAAVGGAVIVSDYPRVINNSILHNQNMPIADGSYDKIRDKSWSGIKDLSDFDIVVLEGGPNDYFCNVPIGTNADTEVRYFTGALRKHFSLLQEAGRKRLAEGKPRMKVVLCEMFYNPEGVNKNFKGLSYVDYDKAIKDFYHLHEDDPDVDIYYYTGHKSVLGENNWKYETVDNVHMTAYRYGQMGNHLARFLKSLKAKEHVAVQAAPAAAVEEVTEASTEATSSNEMEQIAEPVSTP